MFNQSLIHTYKRFTSLKSGVISVLPIVILMPHSACNCRCIMCDIWKDNANLKQISEDDLCLWLDFFKKFEARKVVMSGGEALLHPAFFRFCEILQGNNIRISLLTTGLLLEKYAEQIVKWVDDIVVSLDGIESIHNEIRNIPEAYKKLKNGIEKLKKIKPDFKVTARSVIHKLNFNHWPDLIESSKELLVEQISFLPADVTSHAFNREVLWNNSRQQEILIEKNELPGLKRILEHICDKYEKEFENNFIAESQVKLWQIYFYYAAIYGFNSFPVKKCNAPWVSAVIEADGTVRPCFFHAAAGNAKDSKLEEIINSDKMIKFRKELDIDSNSTCEKCVCYLNMPPTINPAKNY